MNHSNATAETAALNIGMALANAMPGRRNLLPQAFWDTATRALLKFVERPYKAAGLRSLQCQTSQFIRLRAVLTATAQRRFCARKRSHSRKSRSTATPRRAR